MMRPLQEQTILIMGATDAPGRALASKLAGEGAALLHGPDDGCGRRANRRVAGRCGPSRKRTTSGRGVVTISYPVDGQEQPGPEATA
jgi:NAD(P)-dependent dehydrogenase (short-subunit alcohol dehydrogenase family)